MTQEENTASINKRNPNNLTIVVLGVANVIGDSCTERKREYDEGRPLLAGRKPFYKKKA